MLVVGKRHLLRALRAGDAAWPQWSAGAPVSIYRERNANGWHPAALTAQNFAVKCCVRKNGPIRHLLQHYAGFRPNQR
jgi:hypothetical protein